MRTKILILSAAALLAAGIVSTQAQPVYSQNVVGYANVATTNAGLSYMMSTPFAIGSTNGVNEIFGSTLPSGSKIFIWNQGAVGFDIYYYDTGDPQGIGDFSDVWYASDDYTPLTSLPTLPVGMGFFLVPSQPVTNVFAGTIVVNVGTSNKMLLPSAGDNYMVGSVVPYAGSITNGNNVTGGLNLNSLPSGSKVFVWNQGAVGYDIYFYDTGDPQGIGDFSDVWYGSDDYTPTAPPSVTVGQGFFVIPSSAATWTTGL